MMEGMRRIGTVTALAVVLALSGCAAGAGPAQTPTAASVVPSATPTPTPTPEPLGALSMEQRVGQLFMVGSEVLAPSPETVAAVVDRHAGSIFLHGRTGGGTEAVLGVVAQFTALAPVPPGKPDGTGPTGGIPLWIATDQEGGEVQVIRGPGVDDIPYAIRQADLPDDQLQAAAGGWGAQLAAAGVTMNLAPVADIVTSHDARFDNPPVGALGRQYGYDAPTVQRKAGAFAAGMRSAGILPVFKHFPGLGHVGANTDVTADVIDTTVTADGPDVRVYGPLTQVGPSAVMMSAAVYQNIDPSIPAVFSPTVVGLLRSGVGFDGVIMTDDLSAAAATAAWARADRALMALEAGVDLLLVSADPSVYAEMYDAVLARAYADPAFAAVVDAAATRVIAAKAAHP